MSFERKIAGLGLAETKAPTIAPTDDQKPGVMVLSGGGVVAPERGHKNWGQTINQGFELRSLMTTMKYWEFTEADDPGFAIRPDEFGYFVVRAPGGAFLISLSKPDGVPASQHTKLGKYRYRQRWGFLEIFYPVDTMLSFTSDFAFTTAAWKPLFWEQPDLALLLGEDSPITYAQLTKDILPQRLDELLAEGPRLAGTSDLFFYSYNERTGKATVVLLSGPAGMEGMDPEVPDPDATEPVPGDGTTTPTPKPWEKPKKPKPGSLDPNTQNDYTDPVTGLPLVPTPPPAAAGTLYALHGASVSVSDNGGASWAPVNISGAATLVDLVATPAGLFVLDSAGQVFTAATIGDPFQLVALADTSTGEVEIPLANPGFETGDISGWVSIGDDEPRALRTTQPPQMPGSTHYLTRDWRIVSPQPFVLQQVVQMPADIVGQSPGLSLVADVYCENSDIGRIEILDALEVVVPNLDFSMVYSGGKFRAMGFATSVVDGPLNLIGTPVGGNASWSISDGYTGVQLNGSTGQAINGAITWRVEKADGSLFDGQIAMRLFDLDNANGTRETLRISGVVSYDLLTSGVTAAPGSVAEEVLFTGINSNGAGDTTITRFNVVLRSAFTFQYTGEWEAGLGMKGTGAASTGLAVLASAQSDAGRWSTVRADFAGTIPERVIVRLSGEAVNGYGDVYFDNIRLLTTQAAQAPVVLAIASVEGDQGGAELYLDGGILRHVADPAERGATVEVPASDISMADHAPNGVRVASNGAQAWVWFEGWSEPVAGPFTDVMCDPFLAYVRDDGSVFGETWSATLGAGAWHASGDRRREAALMTEAATGAVKSVITAGTVSDGAQQPVSEAAAARRSIALDSGRILGWSVGSPDLLWTSDLTVPWKVAGALGAPILKIVELR